MKVRQKKRNFVSEMQEINQSHIKYLLGVGPKKAETLQKEIQVVTWEDMLYYFPYKYIDRSKIFTVRELQRISGQERNDNSMPYIQLKGKISDFQIRGEGSKRRLSAVFSDDTGSIDLVWFQMLKHIMTTYNETTEYILFGKPTVFGHRLQVAHPELETENKFYDGQLGVQGLYNTTERMKNAFLHSRAIQKIITQILENIKTPLPETLPQEITDKAYLVSLDTALRNIHFPQTPEMLRQAQYRLKFEELFYLQLNILRITKYREKRIAGLRFSQVGEFFNYFYFNHLPFELTGAQKRVVKEIRQDANSGRQMNRLLQGDVGSGKTLVALLSVLIALDNGFQGAIMAPTEILATQHYETISELLAGMPVEIALLTGSTKKKVRTEILPKIKTGEIKIVIGTHALIEDTVEFANLGLVVVDEQHRFGVVQRARLWKKNATPPHVLVMTATPIPRTLAMTVYGDLDVSVIDELPPGRKPVKTVHTYEKKRGHLYESVRKQLQEGRQVYIVYPLIEESEKVDIQNLLEGFEKTKQIFPEYKVSMLHGKMKPAEKDAEMQRFVSGETQIMVATTVIEVGVNVPNASVMLIENAERFGLPQLHQLRGRVGRGADQSFCILVTKYELSENTRKRLAIMTETNDGFRIAEEDLKLRGPGDIDGTQQSGIAFNLKIANLAHDGQILTTARDFAQAILDADPLLEQPQNALLARQLVRLNKEKQMGWFMIS
ncbi:ATP-dependent DNA helicase RecG [Candidatus Symbiothrix dinenymphae]|uniref:ATP-dependent DNA helicase RecG n=1 Tax=Candidatus Symbiothrix dinenymphae TaxID=467085 RepID=UPI001D03F1D8|nr:ATP-dependent DNA helicase RecG [Candidatus Symbiothrix dinenymphae]